MAEQIQLKITSSNKKGCNHSLTRRLQPNYQKVNFLTSLSFYPSIAACAAANLAIGTRNGEQLT